MITEGSKVGGYEVEVQLGHNGFEKVWRGRNT